MESGVHATLAGVATALAVPLTAAPGHSESTLERLELALEPWVRFVVLPVFAFANAGVSLAGISLAHVTCRHSRWASRSACSSANRLGIFAFARSPPSACGLARMPAGATRAQIFGIAILGGIGFTMSLFIGMLAFPGAS